MKYKLGLKLGFSIPENVAKKELQLPHYGSIVINTNTKIGENCRIHIGITLELPIKAVLPLNWR